MSDKELIKQEIERRIDLYSIAEKDDLTFARMGELSGLIDFIDSLPEEPASEDLEEEIEKEIDNLCELGCYMEDLAKGNSEGVYHLPDNVIKELRKFARHFAEWQEKKMLGIAEAFYQQGRYEQEQEMMKDAVELHIVESFNPVETEDKKLHGFTALYYNAEFPDFYPITGQTIKVIPTKEIQQ